MTLPSMLRLSLFAFLLLPILACVGQSTPGTGKAAPTTPITGSPQADPAGVPVATPALGSSKVTYSECHVDGLYIAMTFDDGPSAENTPRLLDMLKKRNIKATFFLVGQCAAEYPDIVKRTAAEGHELGNHSWSHPQLTKMGEGAVTEQLQHTHDVVAAATGVSMKVMRPPYGAFSATQRAWANKKWGYKIILWDVDPLDWKVRNAAHVENEILKQTVGGSIVLSHDIHKSTVDAMPATLDALAAKGFKFVTVSELLAMDRPAVPKAKPVKPAGTPKGGSPAATPVPAIPATPAPGEPARPNPGPAPETVVPAPPGVSKSVEVVPVPATGK